MRRHFWTYLALSTMAVAQPILDLYGRNITVFSAAKLSRPEVVVFLVLVLALPALIAFAIDWLSRLFGPRVNESVRLVLIAAFSLALGFAIARWVGIERNRYSFGLALVVGVAVPWAFDKSKAVREWSRWLAVLALVVAGNAVFQLRPVLATKESAPANAVMGNKDVSVLLVVFDEFPLFPLLTMDGTINAEKYPGFAELAANSTWYRDSVTQSNFTHKAVPSILASRGPSKVSGPYLYEYPHNLFTVFEDVTKVVGHEPVTSLCPDSVCQPNVRTTLGINRGRLWSFLKDASSVYGQRVLPAYLRQYVPRVADRWGAFTVVAGRMKNQMAQGVFSEVDVILDAADSLVADPAPRVQFVHALLPHRPHRMVPDGRVMELPPGPRGSEDLVGPETMRDRYQRFLYQLGETDNTVAAVIKKLKDAGRWDDTMVIFTADHGHAYVPMQSQRNTGFTDMGRSDEIFRVPTFIKYPNQKAGAVSDCPITSLDVLPTILDVTRTTTDWTFEGASIVDSCPSRTRKIFSISGESTVFSEGFEATMARVALHDSEVSTAGPLSRVAAVGASAPLIGTTLGDAPIEAGVSWTVAQKGLFKNVKAERGSLIPAMISGTVSSVTGLPKGTEGIVVVDGVAAGVIGETASMGKRTRTEYVSILDYTRLTPGDHTVELYLRGPDGTITKVGPPR